MPGLSLPRRRLHSLTLVLACLAALACAVSLHAAPDRLTFAYAGHPRTVFVYAPPDPGELPLIVLLHGSGRDGTEMLAPWKALAASEHVLLAAPNSLNATAWDSLYDPPAFLHAVVDQVSALHAVDHRRTYLFGHSGGAVYALALALIDSEFYAAVAVHAGALPPENDHLFTYSRRPMPVALWVGDSDPFFPLDRVTATAASFDAHGVHVQLHVLHHHGHDYASSANEINQQAWAFFKPNELPASSAPSP